MQKNHETKKIIRLISFTDNGRALVERIKKALIDGGQEFCLEFSFDEFEKEKKGLSEFCARSFSDGEPLVFVGAIGIAVRTIAPFVRDKLTDPPVLVMDELGLNIIPILSGHVGGSNELAILLARKIGARPIITTATDLNKAFSVDLFAKENNLEILNREGIAEVSMKALSGKPITISIENYPPTGEVDVAVVSGENPIDKASLSLASKENSKELDSEECGNMTESIEHGYIGKHIRFVHNGLVLGIGCKKGKSKEDIVSLVRESLESINKGNGTSFDLDSITAIATIDIKAEEPGLVELSEELSVPLITFDSEVLAKVEGDYSKSEFVKTKVGVDNVCERAAVLAAGYGCELILKKTARDGVTLAIAEVAAG